MRVNLAVERSGDNERGYREWSARRPTTSRARERQALQHQADSDEINQTDHRGEVTEPIMQAMRHRMNADHMFHPATLGPEPSVFGSGNAAFNVRNRPLG